MIINPPAPSTFPPSGCRRVFSSVLFLAASVAVLGAIATSRQPAVAAPTGTGPLQSGKIAPWVMEHTAKGQQSEFFVILAEQADISAAANSQTKAEKGRFVYSTLFHKALKPHYRGWDGQNADHDYNWHDSIHNSVGNVCGNDSPFPCDDQAHGTHTTGTMVGDDGQGNQIGMAPGARWIGCRNMDANVGTPDRYIECMQWFLAPTRINGTDPDPTKAPDITNNSWECPPSE